jgi:sulfonate transport system substrate-binding protein
VNFVNLAPGLGAAAFDSGKVDAWAIWQPQVSIEQQKGARIKRLAEFDMTVAEPVDEDEIDAAAGAGQFTIIV